MNIKSVLTHSVLWASALITLGGCEAKVSDADSQLDSNGNCLFNVTKGSANAWIQNDVQMHFIFWGNFPVVDANQYQYNWSVLLTYPALVLDRLAEYGIQTGSLDNQYYTPLPDINLPQNTGAVPGTTLIDDGSISTELNNEIQSGAIPPPNDNTNYMVMLPPNVLTHNMYYGNYAGYHAAAAYGGQRYTWGVIRYYPHYSDGDQVISHELAESATDP